ncbi:MAG TPA: tetratricopeptide repeat protein [Bacteroidia bacterium]
MKCKRTFNVLYIVCVFCILHANTALFAQSQDSLLRGLYNWPDTVYVDKLVDASKKFRNQDADKALEYALKTRNYFSGANDQRLGKSYAAIGIAYDIKGKYDSASYWLNKSLVIAEKLNDSRAKGSSLLSIGVVNLNKGNYDEAISYYNQALSNFKAINEKRGEAQAHNNIGVILKKLKRYDEAIEHYNAALEINKAAKSPAYEMCLTNIANIYCEKKDFVTAKKYFDNAIKDNLQNKNYISLIRNRNSLAQILIIQKKYKDAGILLEKNVKLGEKQSLQEHLISTYNNYADLYFQQDSLEKAQKYSALAVKYAKKINNPEELAGALAMSATINSKTGNLSQALLDVKKAQLLKDSLLNEQTIKSVNEVEGKYQLENKKLQIENLEKEKAFQGEELARKNAEAKAQRSITIALVVGAALLLLFLIAVYRSYQQKKKDNIFIQQQNKELEQKNTIIEKQKHILEEHQKEIVDSINYAKRIQYALLAGNSLLINNLPEHFVLYKPKDIVSGDFYWACPTPEGFIYITADCTGHGVPGAFMSLLNISKLSQTINEKKIYSPEKILNVVREEIITALNPIGSTEESKDGMDAILCKLDVQKKKLQYAAANNSFYIIRNQEIIHCKADKMPVGKGQNDYTSFTLYEVDLLEGDIIYTLTDGFVDQFGGPRGKKFKKKKLELLLMEVCNLPMQEQMTRIESALNDWKGQLEQVDDVCLIGVKI